MQHYLLRAESRAALFSLLVTAQSGKEKPFVVMDEGGELQVDASRIRYPYEEVETGEDDPAPTGFWLCDIWLEEVDASVEVIAF